MCGCSCHPAYSQASLRFSHANVNCHCPAGCVLGSGHVVIDKGLCLGGASSLEERCTCQRYWGQLANVILVGKCGGSPGQGHKFLVLWHSGSLPCPQQVFWARNQLCDFKSLEWQAALWEAWRLGSPPLHLIHTSPDQGRLFCGRTVPKRTVGVLGEPRHDQLNPN